MKQTISILAITLTMLVLAGCLSSDPFGQPPKGESPNCGPEHRYAFNATIGSKADFIEFLKKNYRTIKDPQGNEIVKLDNFKNYTQAVNDVKEGKYEGTYEAMKYVEVDWEKVLSETKTENVGLKTIYVLDYAPMGCNQYIIKMTSDGYVSVYGCCGV